MRPSMGSVGDVYGNAMAEISFSTLKAELLSRRRFGSQAEARMACFRYIEGWHNPSRLHSGLGCRWPRKPYGRPLWSRHSPQARPGRTAIGKHSVIRPRNAERIRRPASSACRNTIYPGISGCPAIRG